jgi:hypothetical protein
MSWSSNPYEDDSNPYQSNTLKRKNFYDEEEVIEDIQQPNKEARVEGEEEYLEEETEQLYDEEEDEETRARREAVEEEENNRQRICSFFQVYLIDALITS